MGFTKWPKVSMKLKGKKKLKTLSLEKRFPDGKILSIIFLQYVLT